MRKWYPAVLVALSFVISIIAFGHLPDPMPIHWDIHGRVNGYGSRWVGAFLNPLVLLGIAIMIPVLPKIDPRGRNYEKFGTSYLTMMNTIATVLFVIHILVLANVLGMNVSIGRVIPAILGVLFIVIGNVLPRVRPNWMVGVRTPWTLSSDRVWERTHRVGGYLMLALGLALLLSAAFAPPVATFALILGGALVVSLGTIIYSYIVWRQEKKA